MKAALMINVVVYGKEKQFCDGEHATCGFLEYGIYDVCNLFLYGLDADEKTKRILRCKLCFKSEDRFKMLTERRRLK